MASMPSKQFRSAMRKLRKGVPIYRKGETTGPHKHATFKVEFTKGGYRGIVIVHTDFGDSYADMILEVPRLDWLRRIACGYYPAVAKAFGPARQYAGL